MLLKKKIGFGHNFKAGPIKTLPVAETLHFIANRKKIISWEKPTWFVRFSQYCATRASRSMGIETRKSFDKARACVLT